MVLVTFLVLLLIVLFIVGYYSYNSINTWRHIKASKLSMNYLVFLANYISLDFKGIPPGLIFDTLVDEHIAGIDTPVEELVKYYKSLASRVNKLAEELAKTYTEEELVLKRIGGYFLLTGNVSIILKRLYNALKSGEEVAIYGVKKNSAEKRKHAFIDTLFKTYKNRIANVIEEIQIKSNEEKKEKDNNEKTKKEDEEKNILKNIEKYFKRDLKIELEENRVYLYHIVGNKKIGWKNYSFNIPVKSSNTNIKKLKKEIFKTTSEALIKARREQLDISYNKLEVHLGLNGDIEQTVEILLKTKHLGLNISLDDIEKYIIAGGDIKKAAGLLVDAQNAGLKLKLRDLEKYHLLSGDISEVVNALILSRQEGIKDITIEALTEYLSQGGNVTDLTFAVIKLRQADIPMGISELNSFRASGVNIRDFASVLVKAKQAGVKINLLRLRSFLAQRGDVVKLVEILIKTKNAGLDLSIEDYEDLFRIGADIQKVFWAFLKVKAANLPVTKSKLIDIQHSNGDMFVFADALSIAKRLKLDINAGALEAHVIEGRDVKKVIFAVNYARNENIEFSYDRAIRLDREGEDVNEVVKWAVDPQTIEFETGYVLSKDGISMKLFAQISVRGKIKMFKRGSREEVLQNRVNEAIIKEVEQKESYEEVVTDLDDIAVRVLKRLNAKVNKKDFEYLAATLTDKEIEEINKKEEILNLGSAYEVIDVNIPRLELGYDANADIKKEDAEIDKIIAETKSLQHKAEAHAKELEAKAKLIESEAKLNEGMAHAFKKGKMCGNEYLKHQKIFNDDFKDLFNKDYDEHSE